MMLTLTETTIDLAESSTWDELVRQFPDSTVYHTWGWMQAVSAAHGVRAVLAKATVDGECVAVWPFWEMRKGPLRVIGSPLPGWSTAYLGPLFRADLSDAQIHATLDEFLRHDLFRRHAYMACKVITRRRPLDMAEFGFTHVLDLETYCIDLSLPVESLWRNLKSECRTRIRKGEKLGVEIREECDSTFIDDYWNMSLETFQKSKIQPTHSRQFLVEMWNCLRPAENIRAFSAYTAGGSERIGTLVLPHDDRSMYYWGGASFTRFRDVPAHNLLHWHAIREAKAMGLHEYDFISTFGGPGRFKKTFGPQTIHMATHWERSQSRLMAALKKGYQTYLLKRRRIS